MDEIENFLDGLEFKTDEQQEADFKSIEHTLKRAKESGLILEILYEAFNQIKSDSSISISQACDNALWEWDS